MYPFEKESIVFVSVRRFVATDYTDFHKKSAASAKPVGNKSHADISEK
jgi:hypothetical protein